MSKIECRIKRPGGSAVDIPNGDRAPTRYHFKPIDATRGDSPHVAEVEDANHYERFLRLDARVYVPFNPDGVPQHVAPLALPVVPVVPKAYSPAVLYGSDAFPNHIELAPDKIAPLGDVVAAAHTASGLTVEQWNDLATPVRDEKIQLAIQLLAGGATSMAQLAAATASAVDYSAQVSGQAAAQAAGTQDDDDEDTADEGVLSVRQLKAGIADGSLTQEALREILAKEEGAAVPRQSFIAVIVKALK